MHAHHYLQLGLSVKETIELHASNWPDPKRVRSFLVSSDVTHQVRLSGVDQVIMIWLDPEFRVKRSICSPAEILTPLGDLEKKLSPYLSKPLNCEMARQIRQIVTGWPADDASDLLDERIASCLSWIKEHLTERTITAEMLAETVFLSRSRLMHLFSDQIGIPIRKYILWQRLRHALLQLADGQTITEASHAAGFTDSAHMNRTFNTMFGITPSKIFRNSRFIQVIGC